MIIRQINRNDISKCVELIKESFQTVADEFNITIENAPRYVAFSTTEDKLISQFDEGRQMRIFCNEDNQIIGYYSIENREDGSCELNNICVSCKYRNNKIGEQLLEDAIKQAKENGFYIMHISIVEENIKLRRWYERHGFEHMGTKKFEFFPFTCGYMKKEI